MNLSSPDMTFFAESKFFEINSQEKCTEPAKKHLFFNFEGLSWPSMAADPAGTPDFFYMHIDVLNQHGKHKFPLGGWPTFVVFLCHAMLSNVITILLYFTESNRSIQDF